MSAPVIELQDVHVRYKTRTSSLFRPEYVDALAGVSLTVRRGQTLGIVGESGSGKSTSAKVLIGLEKPTSGRVVFAGEPVRSFTPAVRKRLGRILSVVFQDPATALNARMTVRDALLDPLQVHRMGSPATRERKVRDLIGLVGLPASALEALPSQLSGGQRQRVAIARAMVGEPKLILADEPTANLDSETGAQILDLMQSLNAETGRTFVFATHDPAVMARASRIVSLRDGAVVDEVPRIFSRPFEAVAMGAR
jgi:peptide/nickel transport system ATP-binding protein